MDDCYRKSVLRDANVITERGLRSKNSFNNFCSVQFPSGDRQYSPVQYGRVTEDRETGRLIILLDGGRDSSMVKDLMYIGLNQRNSDGTLRTNYYVFDGKSES